MSEVVIPRQLAELIISANMDDIRFEQFCVELFTVIDGIDYVPTSASWDLGRDGRSIRLQFGDDTPFICCSLRADVPAKVLEDLERLQERATVKAIRFCSSQRLSENAREAIKDVMREKCPSIESVQADGVLQIAALIEREERFAKIFERFFSADLERLRTALVVPGHSASVNVTGMRIALTTQLSKSGDQLRTDVITNLILTALAGGKARKRTAIARLVSDQLSLGRIIQELYFEPQLQELARQKLIATEPAGYTIAADGLKALEIRTQKGAQTLLVGQKLVREAIEELTGRTLTGDDFSKLWKALQDGLADVFYQNGVQIIDAIASIAEDNSEVHDFKGLSECIENVGKCVERVLLGGPIAQEIAQAVVDMLHDKRRPTFEWLTNLSASYVICCSLGLEPNAQQAIFARLRNIDLLLDTDIALSLLSEGEQDHENLKTVVKGWQKIGGRLCVAPPVLEESAYHAYIAQNDFNDVFHQMGKYSDAEAQRLITNAFVRGYWIAVKQQGGRYSAKGWQSYINNFRGKSVTDFSRVLDELREHKVALIPEVQEDVGLAKQIASDIKSLHESSRKGKVLSYEMLDKSERDGRLVALLIRYRKLRHEQGATAVLVSSSPFLRKACNRRGDLEGPAAAVMPLGAIAYLLALTPGTQMSLGSLKKMLFNPGMVEKLSPLQRLALRVIYESKEYELPMARRAALQREMDSRITQIAFEKGQTPDEVFEDLKKQTPEQAELFREIIHKSMDTLTYSASERRIQELEKENRSLKEQLAKQEQGQK